MEPVARGFLLAGFAVKRFERLQIGLETFFIERHLLGRERREVVDHILFWEFIQNARIRLHAAEEKGRRNAAEPVNRCAVAVLFNRHDKITSELRGRPQEAGFHNRKDGPVLCEPVFNRRARKRDDGISRKFLCGFCLAGFGILHRLGFVEHQETELHLRELREFALQNAVRRDDDVRTTVVERKDRAVLAVIDQRRDAGRKAFNLTLPVDEERRGRSDQNFAAVEFSAGFKFCNAGDDLHGFA